MSIFDLLFAGCFLGTVFYGGWIAWLAMRQRWAHVRRHALRLGMGAGLYLAVLVAVGFASPRRQLSPDALLRYDDWCLGVEQSEFADTLGDVPAEAGRHFLIVTMKVVSTAGRVRQAAPAGALVYLLDGADARYDVSVRGQAAFEKLNG